MKRAWLAAVPALTLGLAACQPAVKIPTAQSRLDCPEKQGDLTRVGVAADGRSCAYRSERGAEVNLKLVPIKGDPYATLAEVARGLGALPAAPAGAAAPAAAAAPESETARAAAEAHAQAVADAAGPEEEPPPPAEAGAQSAGDRTDVDLPGVRIRAEDGPDGERANVTLPGVQIDADDDRATVKVGSTVHIDADGEGATVSVIRDVRLRGEALSREKRGIRATYILAGEKVPAGYGYVGYEAGGPKTGPLVVAVVRSPGRRHDDDHLRSAVKSLVRKNGGV